MERASLQVSDIVKRLRRRAGERSPVSPLELPTRTLLADNSDLAHLNRHWVIGEPGEPIRSGLAAKLRRWLIPAPFRRWIRQWLARAVLSSLERYLLEEREFLSALVRYQNELAVRTDELVAEIRNVASHGDESTRAAVEELTVELRGQRRAIDRQLDRRFAVSTDTETARRSKDRRIEQ